MTIPHLTRPSLHRCLQRRGTSGLPHGGEPKKTDKSYPIDVLHRYIAEVHTAEDRLYLLVAVTLTTRFAFVELVEKANRRVARNFLHGLAIEVTYKVHIVLTDSVSPSAARSVMAARLKISTPSDGIIFH